MTKVSTGRFALGLFGPGVLLASSAAGLSYVVWGTRAGAQEGLSAMVWIALAHLLKYPSFRLALHYTAATQTSILQAYRRQGVWSLFVLGGTMLVALAGVCASTTLLTSGVLLAALDIRMHPVGVSFVLLVVAVGVLGLGRYRGLEALTRGFCVVLCVAVLVCAGLVVDRIDARTAAFSVTFFDEHRRSAVLGFLSWGPVAVYAGVWQSLWWTGRARERGERLNSETCRKDLHVGFLLSLALGVAFVVIGAGLLHGEDTPLPSSPGAFSRGVVDRYETSVATWSRPWAWGAALSALVLTMLAVLDGFARTLGGLTLRIGSDEGELEWTTGASVRAYWAGLGLTALASWLALAGFLIALEEMMETARVAGLLSAPVVAALHHRAVFSARAGAVERPPGWLRCVSLVSIAIYAVLALGWLWSSLFEPGPVRAAAAGLQALLALSLWSQRPP